MALDDTQPGVRFWGLLGEGGALYQGGKHGRSCSAFSLSFSTLQHHSPGGCLSDCVLQLYCIEG